MQRKTGARRTFRTASAARRWRGAFALAGCGGGGDQASKMTSFSTSGKRREQGGAVLAAGRSDVAHSDLHGGAGAAGAHAAPVRRRRLQRLPDDAGDHAGGRPGEPHRGHAGRAGDARASRCCTSPAPTTRTLRSAYLKARDAFQLADKLYKRAQDLLRAQGHRPGRSRAGRIDARAGGGRLAIQRAGHSRPGHLRSGTIWSASRRRRKCRCWRRMAGEVVERLCSPGQLLQAGGTQCFTLSDMSTRVGAGQRLPERYRATCTSATK